MNNAQKDCLFCKIVAAEIPSEQVYSDEDFIAIKDIRPKAKMHILLIPKKHTADFVEFSAKNPELLNKIAPIAKKISENFSNGEFQLGFNCGATAGQEVFHTHAHILSDI